MKNLQFILTLFILNFSYLNVVHAKPCQLTSLEKEICTTSLESIHPGQFVLGMLAVKEKINQIEKLDHKGKLEDYLKKKSAPAIMGPNGTLYITDRHHTSYALLKAKVSHKFKKFYIQILKNYSDLNVDEFARKMQQEKFVWLYDEHNTLRDFYDLPETLMDLADDPYRSLAWLVRENNGFEKIDVSFQEFYWANFFRVQGIQLNSSDEDEVMQVFKQAMELSKSPLASHLPGYRSNL